MRTVLRVALVMLAVQASGIVPLLSQDPPTETPPAPTPETKIPHRVPRAASPIKVDGILDEPAWASALELSMPWEVWPADNVEAMVSTQALITYDDGYVYAAFRAQDPKPGAIRARLSDRDRAFQDDFVGIVVDTFNDQRRAFEFFVNPLGVQMDLVQDDVNGSEDESWDAIWDAAGRVTENGYEVEMAIPYTSLRFQRGATDQVWGLDLVRIHPRDRRRLYALGKRDRNVSGYLNQIQKIVGFSGAEPGRNLEVTPTFTAVRSDVADQTPGDLEKGDPDYDLGVTARWGITPNLTAGGAINPDFSQVEADAAQLNVNEQFALFYPEKRPLFLEGGDFFETPLRAVYTRTVADPAWGVKLTGKEGRHALGAFVARDEQLNLLVPGPQGSSSESLEDESATDVVLRYRMDLGKNSTVGALLTAREGNEYRSRLAGLDALWRITDTDTLRAQVMGSQTDYPNDFGLERGVIGDRAYIANYNHNTKKWGAWARYQDLGPDFRADMGFLPQVGVRIPVVGAERYWIGDPNDWYSRVTMGGDYDQTVDFDDNLIEREVEGFTSIQGPMQSYYFLGGGQRLRGFRAEVFKQSFANWFFEFLPSSRITASLGGGVSHRVDFTFFDPDNSGATRQGFEVRFEPQVRFNLGRRVRLDMWHTFATLDNEDGYLFRANLSQMNAVYQLSLRSFVRIILQYSDVRRNLDQYSLQCVDPNDCPAERARDLFTQLLFSYKINPQSVLFLGYSDGRAGTLPPPLGLNDDSLEPLERTFFVKLGYAWVL
jgi:uncharacterized protein DUF5916/cellulose/xylan binding protein with CBM9 domain